MPAVRNDSRRERMALGLTSVAVLIVVYAIIAAAIGRPDFVPAPRTIAATAVALVRGAPAASGSGHGGHHHGIDHVGNLVGQGITLQGALAASTARVLFGLVVGGALGILVGVAMGWSRAVGEYLHPLYVLVRAVPPVALITYVMLWLGHGEAHRLLPIAYAVFVTVVIPAWHGTRDVAGVWIRAGQALGAPPTLLISRVLLPAITPSVLVGLRYALLMGWMTTVGVEMLMAEDGLGHVIVGGGLWASRTAIAADPAVVIVAVATVAAGGGLTDAAMRLATRRLTAWSASA
jgi:ABC-type nitrate/sulfonate/bicarbonate transport system permease component